jgi:hypothetical protein
MAAVRVALAGAGRTPGFARVRLANAARNATHAHDSNPLAAAPIHPPSTGPCRGPSWHIGNASHPNCAHGRL